MQSGNCYATVKHNFTFLEGHMLDICQFYKHMSKKNNSKFFCHIQLLMFVVVKIFVQDLTLILVKFIWSCELASNKIVIFFVQVCFSLTN